MQKPQYINNVASCLFWLDAAALVPMIPTCGYIVVAL